MAVTFSSSDESVITRKLSSEPATHNDSLPQFDLASTARWIRDHNYNRVALQFPDEILPISAEIAQFLQKNTSSEIVILADTSYGSCCVDEVAAEHYCADAIIHFGHACLSLTPGKLAVRYELGRQLVEVNRLLTEILPLFADRTQTILLLYDTDYYHEICDVVAPSLTLELPNIIVPSLVLPDGNGAVPPTNGRNVQFGRNFDGMPWCSTGNSSVSNDYTILYIGDPSSPFLRAVRMNLAGRPCICYDPRTEKATDDAAATSNRALAKRYYLVERAHDAQRVGILVGTLGVAGYLSIIDRLELMLRRSGKAVYRFVIGKLNPAKLANFADVDIFVLVACPENSLIDSKEFYRPIITPFEMEMACGASSRQWTGSYEVDFRQLLPGGLSYRETTDEDCREDDADVSLITGKVRHIEIIEDTSDRQDSGGQVVKRNNQMAVASNSASEFFSKRSWHGLDPQLGRTAVERAVEGSKGIAMNYSHEPISTSAFVDSDSEQ